MKLKFPQLNILNALKRTKGNKRTWLAILAVVVLVLASSFYFFRKDSPQAEASWWDESWYYRKALVVDYTKVDSELTNFPVAVQFNTTNNIYNNTNSDGSDLRFTDNNGNILKYEIEKWNESGTSTVWVKVPTIYSNASTTFYIYYGNPTATDAQTPTEVWDDDFVAVYHLGETSGQHSDSTKYNNDTHYVGVETQGSYAGIFDGTDFFNGSSDYLQAPNDPSFDIVTSTISMWVKPESLDKSYNVMIAKEKGDKLVTIVANASREICIYNSDFGIYCSSYVLPLGIWTYVVVEMTSSDNTNLYINGLYHSSINMAWGNTDGFPFTMGGRPGYGVEYHGALDEIRYENGTSSAAWIETSYYNGMGTLLSYQAEEQGPGPVAYWSFDEGYGTTANDYTPNANHATISNAVWKSESECLKGKCLYFDGTSSYASSSNSNSLNISGSEITLTAWFKPQTFSGSKMILTKGSYGQHWNYGFGLNNTGLQMRHQQGNISTTGVTMEDNEWHQFTAVYSGGVDYFYIDGLLVESLSDISYLEQTGIYQLTLGAAYQDGVGYSEFFHGFIDEVKIYNYARSADQVKQDYNKGLSVALGNSNPYASLSDNLVMWWQLDENSWNGTNGEVKDSSGSGNNGTASNALSTSTAKFNRAANIDGDGDQIYIAPAGTNLANLTTSSLTMSVWLKTNTVSKSFADITGADTSTYFMHLVNDGSIVRAYFYLNGTEHKVLESDSGSISIGQWYHMAVTRDYQTGDTILYLDGVEVDRLQAIGTTGYAPTQISLGTGGEYCFDGQLDDFRIYNRALSPDEVRRLSEWAPPPVLYMPLDENEGTLVYNIAANPTAVSANIATGTLEASMNKNNWVQGKYGSALKFDGVDDWVDIGGTAYASLHFDNQTLQFWFNPSIDLNNNGLTRLFDGNYFGIYYDHTTFSGGIDNTLFGFVRDSTGTFRAASSDATVFTANTWYHVAMTYSGNNVYLYVNGIRQTNSTSSYSGIIGTTSDDVGFGAGRSGADNFSGIIDDIKIYNYARNQRQILEDMNAGRSNNPIGYWSFDEGQGGTAYDYGIIKQTTGTGYNGTLTNMATSGASTVWTQGRSGSAQQFDGVNDYIAITNNNLTNYNQSRSVSLWFKTNTLGSQKGIIGTGNTVLEDNPFWLLTQSDNNKISLYHSGYYNGITTLERNKWYHLVYTYDSARNYLVLYLDGKVEYAGTVNDVDNDKNNIYIGGGYGGYFTGQIDEVKIYNYSITIDEIRQNFNIGLQNKLSSNLESQKTDGLIGWWKMDEASWNGTAGEVLDSSGNGNHGTSTNAITTSTAKFGRAGYFDGSGDYINASTSNNLEMQTHTLSVWIKPNSITYTGAGIIASKSDNIGGSGIEWGLHGTGGDLAFAYNDGATRGWYIANNSNLIVGNWYHVAFVWRQADGQIDFYVNGQKTDTVNTLKNPIIYSGDTFLIGYQPDNDYFNGIIDDLKIYNIVRTPEQIMREYVEGPPPIGYWKFDDMSGTSAVDSSGNGNTGTLGGGEGASRMPNWDVDGKKGGTLDFDGDDDYVKLLNDFDSANLSISLWFNGDDITGRQLVGHRSITYSSLKRGSDTIISLRTSENVIRSFTVPTMSPNTWYHLVTTRENGVFRVYLNGIESTTGGITDNGDFEINAIGLYQGGQEFDGTIDEVKFYDYALTPRQIVQEYNNGAPLGYWSFDEGEGETVFDRSGNGNNGTLVVGSGGTQSATSSAWTNGLSGKINNSLNFDGIDDRVNLGSVTTGENVTISAWIKTSTSSPEVPIFSNRGSGVYFGIASGKLFIYDNSASPSPGMTSNASVNDNNWHHLVWTSNGSSSIMYIDGEFDSRQAQSRGADTGTAYIAWDASNAVEWFPGQIDEVKIWNYPLTPEEIKKEYNGGFSSFFR